MDPKAEQKTQDFSDVKFPPAQELKMEVNGFFLTLVKAGEPLFRLNTEDSHALFVAHSLVRGIAKCELTPEELKDLNDILEGLIKGQDGGS